MWDFQNGNPASIKSWIERGYPQASKSECNICQEELDDEEIASLKDGSYDPDEEAWCCSNCSYRYFK